MGVRRMAGLPCAGLAPRSFAEIVLSKIGTVAGHPESLDRCGGLMAREPKSQSFLKGLSLDEIAALARIATRVQFGSGETIFRQRGTADRFYVIEEGRVSLAYELPRQRRVQIQEIGPGEALGWSWLARPNKWQFSATAIDRVNVSAIRVADLRALFARNPQLGYAVMERAAQTLLERLQATRHKLRVHVRRVSGDENSQQVC